MKRLCSVFIISGLAFGPIQSQVLGALPIDVLGAEYTTYVGIRDAHLNMDSRETVSATPISDYISRETSWPGGSMSATSSASLGNLFIAAEANTPDYHSAAASAQTMFQFAPVVSAAQIIEMNIIGSGDHWYWGQGNFRLLDLTTNEELWNVVWGGDIWFDESGGWTPSSTAKFDIERYFDSTHTYQFTMAVRVNTGGDPGNPMLNLALSGLQPMSIPEPATPLILGAALMGLAGLRRKFRKS
jgi:hypothetical protein